MEPTAKGRTEKNFSYVVRAPSSDGFDVMNVDVKIDTSWVFQDVEDSGGEQEARSPGADPGTLRKQLESSEQKLLAAVDKYVMSESGLRSRIQELELSERQLLHKVDQLSARVKQEQSAAVRAQEKLQALQGELASQVTLSRIQDEPLSLPREDAPDAPKRQEPQATLGSTSAPGPRGSAGQPSEGCCSWGCVGAGQGPLVVVPGLETRDGSLEDVTGSDRGRPTPAEPSMDEQALLLICGCPSGQYRDSSLLPVELAWISEQRLAAAQAQGSFLLVQTSTLPPWGPAGDPPSLLLPLLLQETSPQESQMEQVLDARSSPAPRASGQPGRDRHWEKSHKASLCQESPQTASQRFPRRGPRDLKDPWKEGGGPEWRTEEQGLQDLEVDTPREDLRLQVQQLRHQGQTLQCQLRDLTSAYREATCLRDQLKSELHELRKKQQEANFAVAPLKAKLASLVQKCRERNHLITHLLQELRRHGLANHLLSETAQSMVDDVALAEYAATFLAPGLPETSHHLDVESEKAGVIGAQKSLLNLKTDSVSIQRPLHSESRPVPEAEWPAQMARLDSPKLPLPSGLTPAPGACPATATVETALSAQSWREEGGPSCPILLRADGLPPPPELLSPARILALHKELRQSICSNSQVNKSPLEL